MTLCVVLPAVTSPIAASWAPEGAPSRRDVALTVLLIVWAVWGISTAETVAWGWLGAGAAAFAVTTGPLAATRLGDRVGAWFRGIGYAGRAVVVILFAATVWTAVAMLDALTVPLSSFAYGGIFGIAVVVAVELGRTLTASDCPR